MRRCGQFGIGGAGRAALEGFCGLVAIAQPPCGEPGDPIAFGDPGTTAAIAGRIRHGPGLRVLIFDVVAESDAVAPFRPRIARQSGIHPVQQQAGTIRIVIGDPFEDRGLYAFRHRTVVDRTGPDTLGRPGLADEIACRAQIGRVHEPARLAKADDGFRLRQRGIARQPAFDARQFDARTLRMEVIGRQCRAMERAVIATGQHDLDPVPVLAVDRFEQRAVIGAVVLREELREGSRVRPGEIFHAALRKGRGRVEGGGGGQSGGGENAKGHQVQSSHRFQKVSRRAAERARLRRSGAASRG